MRQGKSGVPREESGISNPPVGQDQADAAATQTLKETGGWPNGCEFSMV
jgi:hypothetical protein